MGQNNAIPKFIPGDEVCLQGNLQIKHNNYKTYTVYQIKKGSSSQNEEEDPDVIVLNEKNEQEVIRMSFLALKRNISNSERRREYQFLQKYCGECDKRKIQPHPKIMDLYNQYIFKGKSVTVLQLQNQKISDQIFETFLPVLKSKDCKIIKLQLAKNDITAESCKSIGKLLTNQNSRLSSLDLSMNPLCIEGAKHLAKGLRTNRSLHLLSMESTHICQEGSREILKALMENNNGIAIVRLNIKNNKCGEFEVNESLTLARKMRSLTHIDLYSSTEGGEGWLDWQGWNTLLTLQDELRLNAKRLSIKRVSGSAAPSGSASSVYNIPDAVQKKKKKKKKLGFSVIPQGMSDMDDEMEQEKSGVFPLPSNALEKRKSNVGGEEGEEDEEEEEKRKKSSTIVITCGICYDDHRAEKIYILDSCYHKFCYDCLRKWVITKIQSFETDTIKCPECARNLTPLELKQVLLGGEKPQNDLMEKFKEFSLKKALASIDKDPDEKLIWCPNTKCQNGFLVNLKDFKTSSSLQQASQPLLPVPLPPVPVLGRPGPPGPPKRKVEEEEIEGEEDDDEVSLEEEKLRKELEDGTTSSRPDERPLVPSLAETENDRAIAEALHKQINAVPETPPQSVEKKKIMKKRDGINRSLSDDWTLVDNEGSPIKSKKVVSENDMVVQEPQHVPSIPQQQQPNLVAQMQPYYAPPPRVGQSSLSPPVYQQQQLSSSQQQQQHGIHRPYPVMNQQSQVVSPPIIPPHSSMLGSSPYDNLGGMQANYPSYRVVQHQRVPQQNQHSPINEQQKKKKKNQKRSGINDSYVEYTNPVFMPGKLPSYEEYQRNFQTMNVLPSSMSSSSSHSRVQKNIIPQIPRVKDEVVIPRVQKHSHPQQQQQRVSHPLPQPNQHFDSHGRRRWAAAEKKRIAGGAKKKVHPPSNNVSKGKKKKKGSDYVKCPECGTYTCIFCQKPSHIGISCEEAKNEVEIQHDKMFEKWASENNTKPCPQCKAMVNKSGGCNHMTCTACNHEFCWLCLQPTDTKDGHFKIVGGKCPQWSLELLGVNIPIRHI